MSLEKLTPIRNQCASLFDHMQDENTIEEYQDGPPNSPKPKEVCGKKPRMMKILSKNHVLQVRLKVDYFMVGRYP